MVSATPRISEPLCRNSRRLAGAATRDRWPHRVVFRAAPSLHDRPCLPPCTHRVPRSSYWELPLGSVGTDRKGADRRDEPDQRRMALSLAARHPTAKCRGASQTWCPPDACGPDSPDGLDHVPSLKSYVRDFAREFPASRRCGSVSGARHSRTMPVTDPRARTSHMRFPFNPRRELDKRRDRRSSAADAGEPCDLSTATTPINGRNERQPKVRRHPTTVSELRRAQGVPATVPIAMTRNASPLLQ